MIPIGYRTRRAAFAASTAVLALMPLQGAFAQSELAPPATTPASTADEDNATGANAIVVIGTRRQDRSVTNSASPVDVIGSEELLQQPVANLIDSIKNVVPSFFVGQNSISDASTFVRAPSLRGLPADEVLVMIGSKRYNRSALVQVYTGGDTGLSFGSQGADISAIPSLALKNLQVLRDGATAQYGSDAIAGVLNFGLRDNDHGLEMIARYGQFYDKGDGKSYQIAGNAGFKLGSRGFLNVTGEYSDDGQTSRGATRPIAVIFAQNNPSLAAQLPNFPGPVQIWGSSPNHGYKAIVNSAYEVTDGATVYFMGNLAHSHANQSFNYRSAISGTATDVDGNVLPLNANGAFRNTFYLTPCPTGNATCPSGGFVQDSNTFRFTSIYPAGFTPRFIGDTYEAWGTLGVKGKTDSDFTYDISGTLSRNELKLAMTNSLNASFGPQTQTSFEFGKLIQKEINANADFTYPLDFGLASPVTLSFGGEFRQESYTATEGDPQSYSAGPYATPQQLYSLVSPGVYTFSGTTAGQSPGASGYGGTSPEAAGTYKQRSYGVYGGLEGDVTDALSVGLAARYENYNTFGGAAVFKGNAIYKLSDAFSVRGTVGTGFHAPSPGQNNVQILTTNFVGGNQVQTGTYPVTSPIAQFYGAQSLRPERSLNGGVGVVINPAPAFTVTIDGYTIRVKNRIGITQNFTVRPEDIVAQPALAAVGEGGAINYFTNGFNTLTRGVDVVGTYRTELAGNRLSLTFAYNYNKSKVKQYDPAVISNAQIINVGRLAPNHRATLSGTYQVSGFTINVRESYYGSWVNAVDYPTVIDAAGNTLAGQTFGARFLTDLDISYTLNERYTLTVGANNLFNTKPEKIMSTSTNPVYSLTNSLADGQVYARNGGPFGFNGGFWYVRLRVAI